MTRGLPELMFARTPSAPPPGNIQFYDGYFPALDAGTYTIDLKQNVAVPAGGPVKYEQTQTFVVTAPEFALDPTSVHAAYPPAGGNAIYDQQLPFVVLGDPSLPWERGLVPGGGAPDSSDPVPWIALAIFAEGEIELQPNSSTPVATSTVAALLAPDSNVLKPDIPTADIAPDVLASQCQTIKIPGGVFKAVMPTSADLRYLAHCRAVSNPDEGELLLSVVLANRLPLADAVPRRFYAHLVSLEGYAKYLDGTPIPAKPGGGPMDVELVSLYNWTFVSQPETGQTFKQLVSGLIDSERLTPALRLPDPAGPGLPAPAAGRIKDGYAPLAFVTGAGERSFAWYRGPFTPVVPQPLPQVGSPGVDPAKATSADELMIYLAEQGLFDLSYAAAWNIGRQLALADAMFAQAMSQYRREARSALARLAQRMGEPHLAGVHDPRELLARNVARRRFVERVGDGLASRWTAALGAARAGERPAEHVASRVAPVRRRASVHPADALAQPGVPEALADHLEAAADPVSAWLAKLSLLGSVPFSYLVPDPRMLPAESVRFFYVDQGWIDALVAGATSIAIHATSDVLLLDALSPRLDDAVAAQRVRLGAGATGGTGMTGMLIRSALVSGWPALVVTGSLGGAPLPIARNDRPSPSVRVCLFDGVPDEVSLSEPYQGLLFGVEDGVVGPRAVTAASVTGAQIANLAPLTPTFRTPPPGEPGGVLEVAPLASALEAAVAVTPFSSSAVINWNGSALQTTFVSAGRLKAVVPANVLAAPGSAQVTVVDGATSDPATFTIDPPLAIDGLEPSMVAAGGDAFTLAVDGVGFGSDAVVQWNGNALETTVVSSLDVTALVSADLVASAGVATITVATGGKSTAGVPLPIVAPGPAISELEPNIAAAGGPGFALTVKGSGYAAGAAVDWNGDALVTQLMSDTELRATVPAARIATPGTATVTVISGGATSPGATFTIGGAKPTIGSFQQAAAMAGGNDFELVVRGINFGTDAVLSWNGTALKTTWDDAEQVTAEVQAALVKSRGTAAVTVASGGVTSDPASFVVLGPEPGIGLLEPSSAVAGSGQLELSVTGGFGAGDFAIQMVDAPELQAFLPTSEEPSP